MDIIFCNRKLASIFNSEKNLKIAYGPENCKKIMNRMAVLKAAYCLDEIPVKPPERRHELKGDRKGQLAVDLKHPCRLIFRPTSNPLPLKTDGGLDLRSVKGIEILEVEDYHE
ncbi:killer suppression protein [Dehalococcoides mccartyi]|jgi:proteic killer suppression protein|uniref:type II toxin-antitoxin system RelE/ParE family toxin n=1 Tax=Dehalococcoides mccartyi TaxID=61435 RepID=UPI00071C711A|nr:hypothetical protein [Dehalococcoides mccartyi]AQU05234.1 hypothetical protein B1777_00510 [Dehalococcoides mccartyi]AQU06686.1 hypothetical protein B1778_00365 [Dehalococcoides mccartyi]AQX74044.1 hypothetical protein B1776_00370 [Dehalococcoides mccartyi]AQY72557.1 hypothetical protein B1772_00360 [Dehalococcoides mccartyi]KSV17344.1 killer suppression protein [Dehalococcoides mccartyi]